MSAPTSWSSLDVDAGDLRLRGHRTGGPGPAVVLAHGITDGGLCWTRLARALEGEYDLVMYDARGHGRSDKPASGYTYPQLAADLVGLLAALGLERPAVIGHSMGARAAATAAAAHPTAIGCLVLEDPPWRLPGRSPDRVERAASTDSSVRQHRAAVAGGPEKMTRAIRQQRPHWTEEEIAQCAASTLATGEGVFSLFAEPPAQWEEEAARIQCPALLLTGDPEQGAIVTEAVAQRFASLCPQGRSVRLAGAGHSIRRERFDEYAVAVREFLAAHLPR
ncbi:MAG: alpha/beta hydrolase [Gemmatimonadota bacterium]